MVAAMAQDPSTRLGARVAMLRYPCSIPELVAMVRAGASEELLPFKSEREVMRDEAFKATPAEEREALEHMSSIWSE